MKRRDFLKTTLLAGAVMTVLGKAAGIMNDAAAQAVVWVKPGKLGYKEVAPDLQVKAGKKCGTCKHYQADAKTPGGGLCVLPAMGKGYVKEAGYCTMWMKKA
jgi:anaerobic selenocysteine-containing dehydrogenase